MSYVHVCTEWAVENKLTTDKPNKDSYKYGKVRAITVQPTERAKLGGEVATIEELTVKQTENTFRGKESKQVGMSGLEFHDGLYGILFPASKIDGCLQKVVTVSLRAKNLLGVHFSWIVRPADRRRMYDTMRSKFFCPHMANGVSQTEQNCAPWTLNRKTLTNKPHLRLSAASSSLKSNTLDILSQLPWTINRIMFAIMITSGYSKNSSSPHIGDDSYD